MTFYTRWHLNNNVCGKGNGIEVTGRPVYESSEKYLQLGKDVAFDGLQALEEIVCPECYYGDIL